MNRWTPTRRGFFALLGLGAGQSLLGPTTASRSALAMLPPGMPDDAIQLNANENPYGPPALVQEALLKALDQCARYPYARERALKKALARHHGVGGGDVILGCGSGEILRMADQAFLGPEKTLVVAQPTFEAVAQYARPTGAEVVSIPLTQDHRHDLDAMAKACDERTGLVYICNPNNPTGTLVAAEAVERFLGRVPASTVVVVDEAYHEFVADGRHRTALTFLESAPNLLVLRTFSKIFGMAGLRLGYAVGAGRKIAVLRPFSFSNNINALAIEAALAVLEEPDFLGQQRRRMIATRSWLCGELEGDRRPFIPSHANFLMLHVSRDIGAVTTELRKRHILVGRRFSALPQWMRVSIGTKEEMEVFLAALREIDPPRRATVESNA